MAQRPPLPNEYEVPQMVNGWRYDLDNGRNAHVWVDEPEDTAVSVFSYPQGDESVCKIRVSDERVSGFASRVTVATVPYEPGEEESAVVQAIEEAAEWMRATHSDAWSHPEVSEAIFTEPAGYELDTVYIEDRNKIIYYRREGYDPEEADIKRREPKKYARDEQPYLYIHEWTGSGDTTVAVAPWLRAHGPGSRHPEIATIVDTPEECGLEVALSMARQWAREQSQARPANNGPSVGQTDLTQFTALETDGGQVEDVCDPRILTVVSCAQSKHDLADGETVPARELYSSAVHTCKDRYGRHSQAYYIASAKFGLVHQDEELPEYDQRLSNLPTQEQRQ